MQAGTAYHTILISSLALERGHAHFFEPANHKTPTKYTNLPLLLGPHNQPNTKKPDDLFTCTHLEPGVADCPAVETRSSLSDRKILNPAAWLECDRHSPLTHRGAQYDELKWLRSKRLIDFQAIVCLVQFPSK